MNNTLKIGQVARRAGVGVETIRFYEREGLIDKPPRRASGYRQYPVNTADRVRFIKRAKELGFTLKEIRELLTLRAAPRAKCGEVRRRAAQKIQDIDEKIASLSRMREALGTLMAQCEGNRPVTECPILEALDIEKETP